MAVRYALGRWEALLRYCDDGRWEIDDNAAERPLVVQLHGELNLSRIVWRITSRINLAKIRTLEVERAWGGNHIAPVHYIV